MRNCIFYLVKPGSAELAKLRKSLASIKENNPSSLADAQLILAVEGNSSIYENLLAELEMDGIVHSIDFEEIHDGIQLDLVPKIFPHPAYGIKKHHKAYSEDQVAQGFSMGYRTMCRLYSGLLYRESLFDNYDYVLRLDCDSVITKFRKHSLFNLVKNGKQYLTLPMGIQYDDPNVTLGLHEAAFRYFYSESGDFSQRIRFSLMVRPRVMFYTNIELGSLEFFRSTAYQDFFSFLDETGGFYLARWGDAVVKYIAVRSLLRRRQWGYFWDLGYMHGHNYAPVGGLLGRIKAFVYECTFILPESMRTKLIENKTHES